MAPSIFAAIWEMENYINNRLWHIKLRLMDSAFISLSYEWMFSLNHPLILFYLKLQKKKKKKMNYQRMKGKDKKAAYGLVECLFTRFFEAKLLLRQKWLKTNPERESDSLTSQPHTKTHSSPPLFSSFASKTRCSRKHCWVSFIYWESIFENFTIHKAPHNAQCTGTCTLLVEVVRTSNKPNVPRWCIHVL